MRALRLKPTSSPVVSLSTSHIQPQLPNLGLPARSRHSQLCPLRAYGSLNLPFRGSQRASRKTLPGQEEPPTWDPDAGQTLSSRPKSTSMAEDRSQCLRTGVPPPPAARGPSNTHLKGVHSREAQHSSGGTDPWRKPAAPPGSCR